MSVSLFRAGQCILHPAVHPPTRQEPGVCCRDSPNGAFSVPYPLKSLGLICSPCCSKG